MTVFAPGVPAFTRRPFGTWDTTVGRTRWAVMVVYPGRAAGATSGAVPDVPVSGRPGVSRPGPRRGVIHERDDGGGAAGLADILAEVRAGRERPLLLPAGDAAALAGMSRSVFYRQVSAGKLPPAVAPRAGAGGGGPTWNGGSNG